MVIAIALAIASVTAIVIIIVVAVIVVGVMSIIVDVLQRHWESLKIPQRRYNSSSRFLKGVVIAQTNGVIISIVITMVAFIMTCS